MRKLAREEKVIIIVGFLLIVLLLGLGVTKEYWRKDEKTSFNKNVDTVSLIESSIELEAGDVLNTDIKKYLKGDDEDIKGFSFDTSRVDVKKVGNHTAYFTKGSKKLRLTVKIKDTLPPELSLATNSMEWVLDGTGGVENIRNTIKASAIDKADGDISNKITGWPENLPTGAQDITYTLKVKDTAGHESVKTFVVRYRVREVTPPPANGETNNPPQQPSPPADKPPVEQPQPPVEDPELPVE